MREKINILLLDLQYSKRFEDLDSGDIFSFIRNENLDEKPAENGNRQKNVCVAPPTLNLPRTLSTSNTDLIRVAEFGKAAK